MKTVLLFYNTGSGDGAHSAPKLRRQIEAEGFTCKLLSRKGKGDINPAADIYAVAGGDGTIRKFVLRLLEQPLKHLRPIALLPLGTANNIAGTLKGPVRSKKGVDGVRSLIALWAKEQRQAFDVGRASGARSWFFLEAMGYGIFPRLMRAMKKVPAEMIADPDAEFETAYRQLAAIAETYKPVSCTVLLDGVDYSGKYLMIELMNIRSLGSNMLLAPDADPADGMLDVVLVPADGRAQLLEYLKKAGGRTREPFPFKAIKARQVELSWKGKDAHVDDETIDGREKVQVGLFQQLLHFL